MSPWERVLYLLGKALMDGACTAVIQHWPEIRRLNDATAQDAQDVPQAVVDRAKEAYRQAVADGKAPPL